jgi:hypothetical protein
METFTEVLKYTLPSVVVFLTVYFLLKQYFEMEKIKLYQENQNRARKDSIPVLLNAYERMAMFLERIRPTQLIMRLPYHPDSSPDQYVRTLMLAIQQEYDHNMTMQVYVSDKLWEIIVFAKNTCLTALNESAGSQSSNFSATQIIQSQECEVAEETIRKALEAIRKEIKLYL